MDPKIVLGFIFSHYVVIFGTTLALFCTVSMILLIRSIGQKGDEVVIDVRVIEGAMKRVLASQPVSVVSTTRIAAALGGEAPTEGESAPADQATADGGGAMTGDAAQAIADRDAMIESLQQELAQFKSGQGAGEAAPTVPEGESPEMVELKSKLGELQARLAEYEIIEDDIADLSMYKEENTRLKAEVASLQKSLASGGGAAPSGGGGGGGGSAEALPPIEINYEKAEKLELDFEDDIMKEFAAAVEANIGVPIAPEFVEPVVAQAEPEPAPVSEPEPEPAAPVAEAASAAPIDLNGHVESQADIDALFNQFGGETSLSDALAEGVAELEAEIQAVAAAESAQAEPEPEPEPEQEAVPTLEAVAEPAAELVSEPAEEPIPEPAADVALESSLDMSAEVSAEVSPEANPEASTEASPEVAAEMANHTHDDPLAGTPDPDKIISEVEAIGGGEGEGSGDVLEDALDADKLLAEVSTLEDAEKKTAS